MIKSFGSVGSEEAGNKSTELANGIAEALNCTAFGFGTSLVGLLGFTLLQGKTTHVVDDINEVTVQVVNLVTSHRAQMQPSA
jgi:biopolymer transport protein ExbB